jgi:recombination protein RecA
VDREKSLDTALANIEKQFGKGSVMRLGDEAIQKIAAIPTGALSLDLALGIGGLPRGRVVEIFGPESSGKCLPADTHVWTDHGLETIAELFTRVGQPVSCTSRVTDVSDQGVRLVNEESQLELLGGVTHNNRKAVWQVTLQSGRQVKATANHPLRVLNDRGRIVWRTVGELREGDVLVSALFGAETAVGGDHLSEDEAVLLGYLVAEGTLGAHNRHAVVFTNAHDDDVLAEYAALLESLFGVSRDQIRTYADKDHKVHDTALRLRLADEYGLDFVGSDAKEVPYRVRTGGAKVQRAFLSALYEGDGWIEDGPSVGLTTASRLLAEQVQLLLYGLGIPASLRTRHNADLDRDYFTVLISSGGVQRFFEQVGFRSARRAAHVERHLKDAAGSSQYEHLPYMRDLLFDLRDALGGDRELDALIGDLRRSDLTSRPDGAIDCSPARLLAVLEWIETRHVPASACPLVAQLHELAARPLTFERITGIEAVGDVPTFDVVVPGTHSFVANGVLSHNTTVALHVVAEAQKAGGIAAFIDAEHALDPTYARALGVDINELLVSQPDTGEQALEIADMLIRSGAIDVVVIDSVAALTPRAEIEGEMGDTHVGLQARLMSQALRKLAGSLNRSNTCAVFINQLREKIGVMFGCFDYQTRVTLADGTQEKIGRIVNQKLPVEVLSYDFERGEFVPRKVVNWFDNGRADEFLQFTVARGSGNGRSQFACTPNHLIATPHGWAHAGELSVGDTVLQQVTHRLSDQQWQVLLGGLMGDGALSPTRSGHGARFRWGHGEKQTEYGDWKDSLFGNLNVSRSTNDKHAVFYDLQPLPELAELRDAVYVAGHKVLSYDYLKQLTPLSLAVWYMDDGTFALRSKGVQERTRGGSGRSEICVQAFERTSRARLVDYLSDTWGIEAKLIERAGQAVLQFPTAETAKLHALIAPFVHPSMDYKLLPKYRGRFAVEPVFTAARDVATPMPVVSIVNRPPNGRHTHRFDIEVEGSHTYLADGVIVHNSPETTPGGRALKFYSSVRLDVRRIESLKDGTDIVGNKVRVKVVKNKVAPPFRQAEFDIMYGEGISKEGSLIDIGVEESIIRKAGAWYTYEGEQLGQGRENARTFLKENPDVALEIEKRVWDKVGLSRVAVDAPPADDLDDDEE